MIASNPAKAGFSSGTLKSQDVLNIPALWLLTNLEMIQKFYASQQKYQNRAPCPTPCGLDGKKLNFSKFLPKSLIELKHFIRMERMFGA